ncbi:MAG: hypothetical protein KC592_06920 [Nitrospira sp.]|nr:hypothetical protein [Nitrospira sp.]HBP89443.1 hypothetical protein [Nitrospiraceae bacterium]HNP29276.1 hypothetical protein [Nitrospirales bacterium]
MNKQHHRQTLRFLSILCSLLFMLSGCISPKALEYVVVAYDYSATKSTVDQLLVNIARSHHHQPVHFTAISNIAATFDYRFTAGATPPLGGLDGGFLLSPIFGGTIAENPTISINPIEGEDFTQRLLTPLREAKMTLLLRQGVDIDLLLRLMANEIRIATDGPEIAYFNRPSDKIGYPIFRQIVLHLFRLQHNNQLYVEPLVYDREWSLPLASLSAEGFKALEGFYRVIVDTDKGQYTLQKRSIGHTVITNYDPTAISNQERLALQAKADRWPPNDILVDIRPGYPGGEFPIQGAFRLRSFHGILNFLGRTIEEEQEYHVDPDARTGFIEDNPIRTMAVIETPSKPQNAKLSITHEGRHYSLLDDEKGSWNQEAFRLLYQLFQMTVTEVQRGNVPSITIAK